MRTCLSQHPGAFSVGVCVAGFLCCIAQDVLASNGRSARGASRHDSSASAASDSGHHQHHHSSSTLHHDASAVSPSVDVADRPIVARNGSRVPVVLDCAYTLPPGDQLLHVKWFHIRWNYALVFQWIAGQPPQALGALRRRVNLSFVASHTANERHRALQIIQPTVELGGDYLCKMTSTGRDVTRTKRLIVYAPPRDIVLSQSRPRYGLVNVTCAALGSYPEPQLTLYRGANRHTMVPIEGIEKFVSWVDGVYNVRVHRLTRAENLAVRTVFQCRLHIPYTSYTDTRYLSLHTGDWSTRSPPVISISGSLSSSSGKAVGLSNSATKCTRHAANIVTISIICLLMYWRTCVLHGA